MKFSPHFFIGSEESKPLFFHIRSEKEGLLVEDIYMHKDKVSLSKRFFLSLKQLVTKKEKRYKPKKRKGCF